MAVVGDIDIGDYGKEIVAVEGDGAEEARLGTVVAVVDYAGVDEGGEEGDTIHLRVGVSLVEWFDWMD